MKNNVTELVFIIDKSGSMSGMESDAIGGFNSMIERQKKLEGKTYVSTVLFSDSSVVLHDRADISDIKPMTSADYRVGGCTALMDAVGAAIRHIGTVHKYARAEDVPERTIFVITTDGMENASVHYTAEQVKEKIKRQTEKYGWEFVFLAAGIDAAAAAENIGIRRERAANYRHTSEGVERSYRVMSDVITDMRRGLSKEIKLSDYANEEEDK